MLFLDYWNKRTKLIQMLNKILNNEKNRNIAINVVGAFLVRGAALFVSFFTMPVYLRFFDSNATLGIWYTILSVLNWVLFFDLGLGNGLRNRLPACFINHDYETAKEFIASTYAGTIFLVIAWSIIGIICIRFINWNSFLNISIDDVSPRALKISMGITFCGVMIHFVLKNITSILYAIQRSAIVNFLSLTSSILTLSFVSVLPRSGTEKNLINIAFVNVIAVNVPLLIATIIVFMTELREYIPKLRHISKARMKDVLGIGTTLLWLTLVMMVILCTNEFLITKLTNSANVVFYQIYHKIFITASSVFSLALIPIWSAVTKASVEKDYKWIDRLYNLLLVMTLGVFACELVIIPFMQFIVDFWLRDKHILVNSWISFVFALSSTIFFLHNVNTSTANGMSFFKVQKIWMTFAAIIYIPLAWFLVKITGSWVGIIMAGILSLLPFELIEILAFRRMIKKHLSN